MERPLKNKIIDWVKNSDYWFQYGANNLLENEPLSEELISLIYELFKEEYGLVDELLGQSEITYNEITEGEEVNDSVQLTEIKDILNVNALAAGQSISINPNLTLIYGNNGTGKSGYIRLLNNAFRSRGDKNILPNVFAENEFKDPNCKFSFSADDGTIELEYPRDKDSIKFTRFSVFDSHSVKVHLEQDNKLNFTPRGFEFFDKVLVLLQALHSRLIDEIDANRPENDFENHFINENAIQEVVKNLGASTDEEKLKELGNYTKEDADKLEELFVKWKALKALNIPKRITELQNLLRYLKDFTSKEQAILDMLRSEKIEGYKSLVESYIRLRELTKQEGINSLKDYDIASIGSNEWKSFIKASQSYANLIEASRKKAYPQEEDNCLFCLRPITEKESSLIEAYWKLLKSEAEAELHRIIQRIEEALKNLKDLTPVKFDESTLLFTYVYTIDTEFAQKWKKIIENSRIALERVISNLSKFEWEQNIESFTQATKEFDGIQKSISDEIEELIQKNPEEELRKLEAQINYLKDKNLLSKLLDKILAFVKCHKWASRAKKLLSVFNTRAVTNKQGELFNEIITEKYTETFNCECETLDAPTVVNIVQRNEKASTLRKLQIAGRGANDILSEGEQRAISLADFLTEVQLDPNNKGIFFDDPVSSQDHLRREKIASRLVQLAQEKQIVVFTHDIAFFIRLKILAEMKNLNHEFTTIRKMGDI